MTATDELRRMLNERGVDSWASGVSTTRWRSGDTLCRIDEWGGKQRLLMIGVTPEQAVEATLGRETCHNSNNVMRSGELRFECSECGGVSLEIAPRYCPMCGREVVDG